MVQGTAHPPLIEITARHLDKKDPETGKPLVDVILDKAGQKGTGKWTLAECVRSGHSDPDHDGSGGGARSLSAMKDERVAASAKLRRAPK